ncbi:MAG TPA: STN domain-containing protein [Opitutaceae bacterium]|nr:STN domain-containing protein [Opitutaceae bacterium]
MHLSATSFPRIFSRAWSWRHAGLFIFTLALAGGLHAAEAAATKFDISAGPAEKTLRQFAEQSGADLSYPAEQVRGVRTNPVRGDYTPGAALKLMVGGTPLTMVQDRASGAFVVRRRAVEAKNAVSPLPPVAEAGVRPANDATDERAAVVRGIIRGRQRHVRPRPV